jgi:hypothetical protein
MRNGHEGMVRQGCVQVALQGSSLGRLPKGGDVGSRYLDKVCRRCRRPGGVVLSQDIEVRMRDLVESPEFITVQGECSPALAVRIWMSPETSAKTETAR